MNATYGGSGGGGGYFGGGGGYGSASTTFWASGGGGGASYLGTMTSTTNTAGVTSATATIGPQAPGSGESGYVAGVGNGGSSTTPAAGKGLVTITYTLLTPPTLTAAAGATVDAPFNVTFTDNSAWRSAITSITVGGTTLTAGYSVSAGQITFTPSASSPANLLQTSGSLSIVVNATGYNADPVTQPLGAGAATKLGITTQPTGPAINGAVLGTQPVVAIQDQFGNTTTSTATVVAAVGAGSWTIGGTTSKAGVSGTATFTNLTATSAAAVSGATISFTSTGLTGVTSGTFNIPAPPPPLTGTLTVGTGGDFTSLTNSGGFFAAVNGSVVTGNITVNIISDLTGETGANALNQWTESPGGSNYTITIQPSGAARSITGTTASNAMLRFNGASRVTIDGSLSGGTDRSLTIENTSTTSPQVVRFGSIGAAAITNDTLKNCVVRNGINTGSAVVVTDNAGTAGTFNNITIQNNDVQKAFRGIFANATISGTNGSGLLITGNSLNTAGANSIRLNPIFVAGANGVTISNNTIGNISDSAAEVPVGILLSTGTDNATVTGNTISSIVSTNTSSTGSASGILVSVGASSTSIVVSNNTISTLASAGTSVSFYGIASFSPNVTISGNTISGMTQTGATAAFGIVLAGVTNNSVTGNTVSAMTHSSTSVASGIQTQGTSTGVVIDSNRVFNVKNTNTTGYGANGIQLSSSSASAATTVKNNVIYDVAAYGYASGAAVGDNGYGIIATAGAGYSIYFNSVHMNTSQTVSGLPAAFNVTSGVTAVNAINLRDNVFANSQTVGTERYAIYSGVANTVFAAIDYNDYFTTGPNLGFIGTNRATLPDIVSGFGGNANSKAVDPLFVAGTDLRPQTGSALLGAGIDGTGVLIDFLGVTRSTGAPPSGPTIGAYENSVVTCSTPSAVTVGSVTTTSASVSFSSAGSSFIVEYGAPGFVPGTGGTAGAGTIVTGTSSPISLSPLTAATTYDVYVRQVCSGPSYSGNSTVVTFTTACSTASLPLAEGFNTSGPTVFPACWTQQIVSGTGAIAFQASSTNPTTTPFEGTRYVYWNSFNISAASETRLKSPPLTTAGTNSVDVNFRWFNENSTSYNSGAYLNEGVQVQYSLDGNTWINAGALIPRYDSTLPTGTGAWKLKTVTLPAGAGNQPTVYVGFKFHSEFGDNCSLDAANVVASPTISTSGTLSAVDTTYGTASASPTSFSVSGSNLTNNITVTPPAGFEVSITSGSGYTTVLTLTQSGGAVANTTVFVRLAATTAVGTYSGNIVVASSGATTQNVPTVASSVSPAALSITANNLTKTYGTAVTFAGTEFTSLGLKNGETIGSVALTSGGAAATAGVSGSPYALTPSSATGGTFSPSNYTITYNDGALTVNPKGVTVTADGKMKAKDAVDPAFTYTTNSGGLVGSDTLSGALTRVAGERPGSYAILQGTVTNANNPNYAITYVGANLVITGFVAGDDTVTRPANSPNIKIPKATLLANDGTVASNGSVDNTGVTITSVTSGSGNAVSICGAFVCYTPATPSASDPLTFTYAITDGSSTDTGTVTVNTAAAQPFAIQILGRTTAVYNGTSTSINVEFLTSPNTSLFMEYSTGNMTIWTPYANNPANSGPTGDFVLTFTEAGDHATEWNAGMFFRATRQ